MKSVLTGTDMKRLLPITMVVMAGLLPISSVHAAGDADVPSITARVLALFEAKCASCHGPDVQRPKGKFDYVTDLERLATTLDMIEPGRPDTSYLYELIADGEMPPDDSDVPPLTDEEKALVRDWIAGLGASAEATVPSGEPPSPSMEKPAEAAPTKIVPWTVRLGRLHPASVHLPIGLIFGAALAEILMMVSRADLRAASRFCLMVAAVTIVVSVVLGWWNAEGPTYASRSSWELFWHRWVGVAASTTTVAAAAVDIWSRLRSDEPRDRPRRILVLLSAVLVGVAGALGGINVYGLDHYS
ncbi:MAG: hypothetical protein CMJ18_12710 [Phycisphaeraceae bacterium]|nr:hypothetical protein [Phycisphaeraceae bacterium]